MAFALVRAVALASGLALGLALATTPAGAATAASSAASESCRAPVRMVDFGSDGRIGAKWNAATRTIAFGRPQKDGHYRAFIADADGGNERRVAFAAWRDDRHQFPAAWHPAGEVLAMLVEQNEHERSSVDAIPGYGAYTDYWIVRRDGSAVSKIYALPEGYDHAITHAAFSPDGSKFIWTERVKAPRFWDLNLFAGGYVFKVADFLLRPEPHLENVVAASCPATSTRAARSSRSPATTRRSRSTARSSRRTCSPRASTRWTSRAAPSTSSRARASRRRPPSRPTAGASST